MLHQVPVALPSAAAGQYQVNACKAEVRALSTFSQSSGTIKVSTVKPRETHHPAV
jgi:hypothetical protein